MTNDKLTLPPNPFKRQPVRDRSRLAGRAKELERIGYYLRLTGAGQSPHLALVGQRGSGKTSLLYAGEAIANELGLLAVRLDLDEAKVVSQGRFFHELYASLILAACNAGCWSGTKGPIYADLFRMLFTDERVQPDRAVLQFPLAISASRTSLDSMVCSDALISHD